MIQESPDRDKGPFETVLLNSLPSSLLPRGHHKLFECKSLPVVCFWVIQPRCGFSEPQINVHRLSIESWLIFIAVIILEFLIWKGLPRSFPLALGLQCQTQKQGEDLAFARVT